MICSGQRKSRYCLRHCYRVTDRRQVEFREKCGFYQTYLSRIENGNADPSLNAMEVIANAFGLTVFEGLLDLQRKNPKLNTCGRNLSLSA